MAAKDPKSSKESASPSMKDERLASPQKAEEEDLLEEALEETFPASDPMSSMHFTSAKDKKP